MKASELKAILEKVEPDTEILLNTNDDQQVRGTTGATVETDMRTGEIVVIVVNDLENETNNARDFEPHPAFEDVNEWLFC